MSKTTWAAAAHRYELVIDAAGRANVRALRADGAPTWLRGRADHAAIAARDVKLRAEGSLPPAVLFDGIGLGWHLMEAYRQTQRTFLEASGAIYVVEPDLEALAVALHLHDWRAVFSDARVCLFAGPGAAEQFETFLEADAVWPAPVVICRSPSRLAPSSPVAERAQRVAQRRAASAARLRTVIAERYSGREAAWWASRFRRALAGEAPPLRVLCLTSRHTTFLQYSMRDCIAALQELGCETRLLIEPAPHQCLDATVLLQEQADFEPDLIFLLSRMRYEMSDRLHPAIPSVTWDQDALPWVFRDEFRDRFGANDFLFGVKALDAPHIFGWPAQRCRYAELATSARTYSDAPLQEEALTPYRCDISFVSHAARTPEQEHSHVLAWLQHEHLRRVYTAVVEEMWPRWRAWDTQLPQPASNPSGSPQSARETVSDALGLRDFPGPLHAVIYDVFEQCLSRQPAPGEFAAVHQAAMRLADRVFRHSALAWVADWAERTGRRFNLYGNGWEAHPRLASFARGKAENGEELRRIYQASAINLQLMGWGFLHQRALDGLSAGGFFLSRWSLWDDWMPRLRTLDRCLSAAGISTFDDFERCTDAEAKSRVRDALAALGADPRWLANPYCAAARRDATLQRSTTDVFSAYARIAFDAPRAFERLAEHYLDHPAERASSATALRRVVAGQFSYRQRMRDMLALVHDGYASAAHTAISPTRPPPPSFPHA